MQQHTGYRQTLNIHCCLWYIWQTADHHSSLDVSTTQIPECLPYAEGATHIPTHKFWGPENSVIQGGIRKFPDYYCCNCYGER
jgi:hypothetical protein